jgi:2OG-Fe(II) oxygenase superfamily
MQEIEVYDDLIPREHLCLVEDTLLDQKFPWFYNKKTSYGGGLGFDLNDENTYDRPFFVHKFFIERKVNSEFYEPLIVPILNSIEKHTGKNLFKRMIRCKANLQELTPYHKYCYPHIDDNRSDLTMIVYVTQTDGNTVIFNENRENYNLIKGLTVNKEVKPKPGRCVFFDSSYYHCGYPPMIRSPRVLLNFVFEREK